MAPVMSSPASSTFGKMPGRVLAFLGHVDRILEADHGEEGERGRGDHRPEQLPASPALNCVTRETSPWPAPIAHRPMKMMISRPVSSTQVSTTLAFTLSPTPRKLTAATSAMNSEPDQRDAEAADEAEAERVDMLAAKAREAVEAEVMPEHITAKATMKVTKWMPNALCV